MSVVTAMPLENLFVRIYVDPEQIPQSIGNDARKFTFYCSSKTDSSLCYAKVRNKLGDLEQHFFGTHNFLQAESSSNVLIRISNTVKRQIDLAHSLVNVLILIYESLLHSTDK